jgi:hypothetical protein
MPPFGSQAAHSCVCNSCGLRQRYQAPSTTHPPAQVLIPHPTTDFPMPFDVSMKDACLLGASWSMLWWEGRVGSCNCGHAWGGGGGVSEAARPNLPTLSALLIGQAETFVCAGAANGLAVSGNGKMPGMALVGTHSPACLMTSKPGMGRATQMADDRGGAAAVSK